MNIPDPIKLPSGRYRIQIQVDGVRYGQTFDTPEEAVYWAVGLKTKCKESKKPARRMTVNEAMSAYIEMREPVLSPATISGYRRIQKNLLPPIAGKLLPDLSQDNIQRWVNQMVKSGKTEKTIANAHGLLSAVLTHFSPDTRLTTRLPQRVKKEIQVPTKAEIKSIAGACRGTRYELPIMLAIWLGLRKSEIRGLRWSDIDGEYLNIHAAIVDCDGVPVEKGTKTISGTRRVHIPPYLQDLLASAPKTSEFIVPMTGAAIYDGFIRACDKAGVPHYRFHDLRHVNASVMLEARIPNKYSQRRMGHATDNMLKNTYQHIFRDSEAEYDAVIESAMQHILDPEK